MASEPGSLEEREAGVRSPVVRTVGNASESMKLARHMLESAESEALLMFASARALTGWLGAAEGTGETRVSAELKPKLLIPYDENTEWMKSRLKSDFPFYEFRVMDESFKDKVSILIVDRTRALILEVDDDNVEDGLDVSPGSSTYIENGPLVESYAIMFKVIWKQTELYEQMEMHDRMQRDFVNIAAHELRTPVQAIINYAELARSHGDSRERYFDRLIKSALRLQRLTDDILDAARIESRTLRLNKEVFLLNEILRGTVDEQRREASKKGLKLHLDHSEPVYLFGDKSRVGQVLANLLTNAVKFTDRGSVTVRARLDKRSGTVVVRVADTGIGIDKAMVPLLFARFVAKSDSGTGLGLFISKSIIESHGGKIWLENSEPGKGSTFAFELPVSSTVPPTRRMPCGSGATVRSGLA